MWDEMCAVWKRYRCAKPNHGTRVILWYLPHTACVISEITAEGPAKFKVSLNIGTEGKRPYTSILS